MTVVVVKASDVTAAIAQMLLADSRFGSVQVTRAEELNESPGACPWVGIYRSQQQFSPRLLGAGTGVMKHELSLVVVLQAAGGVSGEDCEAALETLVAETVSVLLGDHSLAGTVAMLTGITVQYQDYSRVEGTYMQTAAMYVTAETTTTIH